MRTSDFSYVFGRHGIESVISTASSLDSFLRSSQTPFGSGWSKRVLSPTIRLNGIDGVLSTSSSTDYFLRERRLAGGAIAIGDL